ncbi:MAG: RagB/SusD family nutrient uptake outer membrane protein [Prevotella sp.]|nr:RagB/SusD family nutrient uptake outer membrane protein [Prevotella sp.]
MKKNLSTYILLASLLFTGCADLDQTSISSIDKDNFYQSKEDIETAINGIYQAFTIDGFYGMYNNQSIYFNDLQSDYVKAGAQTNSAHIRELSNFAIQPTNLFVGYAWKEHYMAINRANVVIEKVASASFLDDQRRQNYTNEARFLRGLVYFNLVRYFGGVPIILHDGEGEGAARNSVDEVYHQIVEDLTAAEGLPSDYTTLDGKASSLAASALLSKVYLVWAQTSSPEGQSSQRDFYQKSINYADKVINSGKYKLLDKFIDNWSVDKKNGAEHIFSIEHDRTINANVTGHCTFATNWSDSEPVLLATSDKYYEQTDPKDQRRDGSWAKRIYNPNTGTDFEFTIPRFRKYIDSLNFANPASSGNAAGQSTNTVIIRYAEILLIKAEAENELNGPTDAAYDAINQVRRRAYWSPYLNIQNTPSDGSDLELSGLTQEQFRERLREERRLEFVLEGQRWFDLIRWHILVKYVKSNTPTDAETLGTKTTKIQNVSKKNYLLPLPQEQIILNPNLEQNWGYSGESGDGPYGAEFE